MWDPLSRCPPGRLLPASAGPLGIDRERARPWCEQVVDQARLLDPSPAWVESFWAELDLVEDLADREGALTALFVRCSQALARMETMEGDQLSAFGAGGVLGVLQRAVLFARLSGPSPPWQWVAAVRCQVRCPVSAAVHRLRWGGEGASRARHRWILERVHRVPLGFGELVLEEARRLVERPEAGLDALEGVGWWVHDPLLDFEHRAEPLARLRARWHLYSARACWQRGQSSDHRSHLGSFTNLALRAGPEAELMASAHELRADMALGEGMRRSARHWLSLALSSLPSDREDLDARKSELLARLSELGARD